MQIHVHVRTSAGHIMSAKKGKLLVFESIYSVANEKI